MKNFLIRALVAGLIVYALMIGADLVFSRATSAAEVATNFDNVITAVLVGLALGLTWSWTPFARPK